MAGGKRTVRTFEGWALTLTLPLCLAACLSSNVQVAGHIDPAEKTMTVPPGNALLIGAIKQRLQRPDWKFLVDAGPRRTIGTLGEKTDLATGNTFLTRYRLIVQQRQVDICILGGDPAINYDLSLIDNRTGEEIISQSGRDCRDHAADKFVAALDLAAGKAQ
jgi:hypothetical protein